MALIAFHMSMVVVCVLTRLKTWSGTVDTIRSMAMSSSLDHLDRKSVV